MEFDAAAETVDCGPEVTSADPPAERYDMLYVNVEAAMSITASEARQRLFPLIEQVNDDQMAVEIVSKKGTAFLVPEAEYHSLLETMYLLSSPRNAERLRRSVAEARAGKAEQREVLPG